MEDDFISKLKAFSVKDVLQDQRPSTSRMSRLKSGRQASRFVENSKGVDDDDDISIGKKLKLGTGDATVHSPIENEFEKSPITTISELLNSRPETAAFKRKETPWYLKTEENDMGERKGHGKTKTAIHNEETVDYIPDLNEIREEDFTQKVAAAPEAEAERITSLRELDADLARIKTFSVVRGVDLRELTKFVFPEKNLIDLEEKKAKSYETRIGGLLPLVNGKRLVEFQFPSSVPTDDFDLPNVATKLKLEGKGFQSIQESEHIGNSESNRNQRKHAMKFDEMESESSNIARW